MAKPRAKLDEFLDKAGVTSVDSNVERIVEIVSVPAHISASRRFYELIEMIHNFVEEAIVVRGHSHH